jgi:opacity protein-like surface antigen
VLFLFVEEDMKWIGFHGAAALAALAALAPSLAQAQDSPDIRVGTHSSGWDIAGNGMYEFGYGIHVAARVNIGVDLRLGGTVWDVDDDRVLEWAATLIWYVEPSMYQPLIPYIGAGVGYYQFDIRSPFADVDDNWGSHVVLGATYAAAEGVTALFEARYIFLRSDAEVFGIPFKAEFDGLVLTAGIQIRL